MTVQCVYRSGCPHGRCDDAGYCLASGGPVEAKPAALTSNPRAYLVEYTIPTGAVIRHFYLDGGDAGRYVDELRGHGKTVSLVPLYERSAHETTGELALAIEQATKPPDDECPFCKGVGEVGIPGATCRPCNGTGRFQLKTTKAQEGQS